MRKNPRMPRSRHPEAERLRVAANPAESAFVASVAEREDLQLFRKGWPDFLVRPKRGSPYAVEVKKHLGQKLKRQQVAMAEVLEQIGVFTFIWCSGVFVPWREWRLRTDP